MSNPYSPTVVEGESNASLWFEKSIFSGVFLEAVAYGLHLSIFGISAYFLVFMPTNGKISWPFLGYITIMLVCGTVNVAATMKFAQMAWIDNRDFPGGPAAFNIEMYSDPIQTLGTSSYITANFFAGALLIWRCYVVYSRNYWVILIPSGAFLASTVLSILTVYQAAQPGASLWSKSAVAFAVPYGSLSITLNIMVSMLIVGRLLWHRRAMRKAMGPLHGAMYSTIAAMVVESAAVYSLTCLIFIICLARDSNVQNLVLGVLSQVECIAPQMIIFRVALGRAWSPETSHGSLSTSPNFNLKARIMGSGSEVVMLTSVDNDRVKTSRQESQQTPQFRDV